MSAAVLFVLLAATRHFILLWPRVLAGNGGTTAAGDQSDEVCPRSHEWLCNVFNLDFASVPLLWYVRSCSRIL